MAAGDAMFHGRKPSGRKPMLAFKDRLLDSIIQYMTSRYSDLDSEIVSATRIASLCQWPADAHVNSEFGKDNIIAPKTHFHLSFLPEFDLSELLQEWQLLKILMHITYGKQVTKQKWKDVCTAMKGLGVDKILQLMDLMLALPPTLVMNERGFSQLKLVKTDRWHQLGNARPNSIMVIRLDDASIKDYNPDSAIDRWMVTPSGKSRSIVYQQRATKSKVTNGEAENTLIGTAANICHSGSESDFQSDADSDLDTELDSDSGSYEWVSFKIRPTGTAIFCKSHGKLVDD